MFAIRSSILGLAFLCQSLSLVGCQSKPQGTVSGAASAEPSLTYGPPVGARVSGSAQIASFEIALAAQGAQPDDCLPKVTQAVSNMSARCPGVSAELEKRGQIAVTFVTQAGLLAPSQVASEYLDASALDCVRGELSRALGKLPHQQQVKYLLQVRPLTS